MRAVRAIALAPFVLVGAARDVLGYRRLPVDAEPGMCAWFATILEDMARFGKR